MLRRAVRFAYTLGRGIASTWRVLTLRARYPGLTIRESTIGPGCEIVCTLGSTLLIEGCIVNRDVTIFSDNGANVEIRAQYLGRGSIIVARERIGIGLGTALGEMVVVRDQDHRIPLPLQEFDVAAIEIGADVWLGAKCSVLRGATIGDGATIGAHALVKGEVEPGSIYAGVPAKRIR